MSNARVSCTRRLWVGAKWVRCKRASSWGVVVIVSGFEITIFACEACHLKAPHLNWRRPG